MLIATVELLAGLLLLELIDLVPFLLRSHLNVMHGLQLRLVEDEPLRHSRDLESVGSNVRFLDFLLLDCHKYYSGRLGHQVVVLYLLRIEGLSKKILNKSNTADN